MNREWYKNESSLLNEINDTVVPNKSVVFWSLGQGGFVIKLKETIIYIDPVLNDLYHEDGTTRRNFGPPFTGDQVKNVDYVFCTHKHLDHLNLETLVPLSKSCKKTIFIVPAPHVKHLADAGIDENRIIGAKEDKIIILKGNIKVTPVGASHEEYMFDENGNHLNLGYIFNDENNLVIYHSGDTILTPKLIERMEKMDHVDVTLLPINGADCKRRSRGIIGNMNARDAADYSNIMRADLVIPFHFDMVQGNTENPTIFSQYMYEHYGNKKYHIMMLGERFIYMK
jgi:L-ascorbate metabolism protein UlaG (beta-lactamase superfamily)